jgi:alkaline phosphatase
MMIVSTIFFLMVECGRIDHAGHANNIPRLIYECVECDLTFQYIKEFSLAHAEETLTIVTADHETEGLTIDRDNGVAKIAAVSWGTHAHTDSNVNIYAFGEWANWLNEKEIDNEEVFKLSFYGNANPKQMLYLNFNYD